MNRKAAKIGERSGGSRPIAPSHDGRRFLVLKEFNATADRAAEKIQIVLNWTEELKRRVPTAAK